MPPEAVSLALAASIYPPALAAVIALGRGPDVRVRVVLLVASAMATVLAEGTLILIALSELEFTSSNTSRSAALDLVLGLVLIAIAVVLRRRFHRAGATTPAPATGPSRTDRYLHRRRLVPLLGFVLYVVPSPIFLAMLNALARSGASKATQVGWLAILVVLMLWLIELPMIALIAFPDRAVDAIERVNASARRHGPTLLVLLCLIVGVYLVVSGLANLS
jgi:hypothetical protein